MITSYTYVSLFDNRKSYGPVAQLGERLICIQEVIGSIPFRSTWKVHLAIVEPFIVFTKATVAQLVEQCPEEARVGGSIPSGGIGKLGVKADTKKHTDGNYRVCECC